MHRLVIDWSKIHSSEQLWDFVCREGREPEWHGRNLSALKDSWVTGDVNQTGPPYEFHFQKCATIDETIQELAEAIMEIARESVDENGGSCTET
jgi:RNAse (barnase) inhibitor barstar